jgi:hypothetical protein
MTRKALIFMVVLSVVLLSCSKKSTTNNYYSSGDTGTIVGFVYPPESEAKVTAYLGTEIAWTHIDHLGYFELTGLPPGTYVLLVEAEGYMDYHSDKTIWVSGGVTVSVDSVFLASVHDLILSVSPSDGALEVNVGEDIEISFRRDMNAALVESAFHVEPEVEGEFFWQDGRLPGLASGSTDLRFVPRDPLATNTRYQVGIDTIASDVEGTSLAEPYEFSFTTEPVRISYTYPGNQQTWVDTYTTVYIRFNTDMNAESVVLAFKMVDSESKDVTGWFKWDNSQSYMTFRPDSALAADEVYSVTIDTSAKDISGGSLDKPYSFWFKTLPGSFGGVGRAPDLFPLRPR